MLRRALNLIWILVVVGFIAAFVNTAHALDQDKQKHIGVSAGIYLGCKAINLSDQDALLISLGAGIAKELYDSRSGGTGFDGEDVLADLAGIGIAKFSYEIIF